MAIGRAQVASVILFLIILLWTTPLLSSVVTRGMVYSWLPINRAQSLGTLLLEDIHLNTSRIECGSRCSLHENCTMFLHDQDKEACALHGLDYPRTGFPKAAPPTEPWSAYAVQTGCPYSYTRRINKCFLVRDKMTFLPEAIAYCNSLGGGLLQYTSMDETLFFQQFMLNKNGNAAMAYYLGAELLFRSNGTFVWSNTSRTLVPGDPMWQSIQPDGYLNYGEDCVEINDFARYMLNDVSCYANRSTICEFSVRGL